MRLGAKLGMFVILIVAASIVCGCAQTGQINMKAPQSTGQATNMQKGKMGKGNAGHGTGMGTGKGMKGNKNAGFNLSALKAQIMSYHGGNLTPIEKEDLLHMIQEEKLAHDVYITLYNKWKLPVFENIAKSEQTHMAAVSLLLQKYNLTNPVANMSVGQFASSNFTELYNKLVTEGSKNITSALKVGALIEDLDIYDLQKCINQTDKQDIKLVYTNLMKGSRNHLRAFVSNLEKYNVTYTPHYISQQEFEQIISTQTERGMAGNWSGSGAGTGNRTGNGTRNGTGNGFGKMFGKKRKT